MERYIVHFFCMTFLIGGLTSITQANTFKEALTTYKDKIQRVSEITDAAIEGTDGLIWSAIKDKGAKKAITYVKDSMGRVYQMAPRGPKLPHGISKQTIQAQAKRYGWKMIPLKNKAAEKLGARLTGGWDIFKLGKEVYDAFTGEESVKTAQNTIIATTIATEVGLGLGYAISLVPGAGVGPGLLAGWAGNNVKTAVLEGLEAWDAQIEAIESQKVWKANDLRLARQKVKQIRAAIRNDDFKKAVKLNQGLNMFSEEREMGSGDMSKVNELTWTLQKKIWAAAKAAKAQEKQSEAQQQAELQAKLDQIRAFWVEEDQREVSKKEVFDVRLIPAATNLIAGEKVAVGLLLLRGVPPFKVSGSITQSTKQRELEFVFNAPKALGVHQLEVRVTDAVGNVRTRSVDLLVEGKARKKKTPPKRPDSGGSGAASAGNLLPGSSPCKRKGEPAYHVSWWDDAAKTKLRGKVPQGISGKYDGWHVTFYKSGKLKSKLFYVCGVPTGKAQAWHENGRQHIEGPIMDKKGRKHGIEKRWHENGERLNEIPWAIVKKGGHVKGLKHGIQKMWREDGTIEREVPWVKGSVRGTMKYYGPDGKLTKTKDY